MNGQNSTTNNSGIDFDEYIGLAKEIINRYEWKPDEAKSLRDRLQRIENKQNDKKLNLSVIGEFSVGKSTFINALLRQELLSSGIIQGTTTVPTIIESSNDCSIVLTSKKKRTDRRYYKNIKSMSNALAEATSSSKSTKNLDKISVYMPAKSDVFKEIRIIDTPGTNSTEAWHTETTERAIRELSDASIVLIDANKILPETQIAFIRNNLEDVIHQCIFVLTKIDLVRPRERNMVIEAVKQKLSYLFNIDNPFVIPYSSLHVLENSGVNIDLGSRFAKDEQLLEMSFENEAALYEEISAKKAVAQSKKLISLLEEMYTSLGEKIDGVSKDYEEERKIIERTKSVDLNKFVNSQIDVRTKPLKSKGEEIKCNILAATDKAIEDGKNGIYWEINSCKTVDAVKSYLDNRFSEDCSSCGKRILNKTYEDELKALDDELISQIEHFNSDFKKNYENLGLLAMKEQKVSLSSNLAKTKISGASASNVSITVSELSSDRNKKLGGGAAAGAAIGTAILPGMGTIAGAFLGAIGGWLFAPDLSNIKAKAKEDIKGPMDNYFENVKKAIVGAVNDYIFDTSDIFRNEAQRYLSEYNAFVNEKIKENNRQKEEIDRKLKTVYSDRDRINTAKNKLSAAKEQLK